MSLFFNEGEQAEAYKAKKTAEKQKKHTDLANKTESRGENRYDLNIKQYGSDKEKVSPYSKNNMRYNGKSIDNIDKANKANRENIRKANIKTANYNDDRYRKTHNEIKNDGSYGYAVDAVARHERRHPSNENAWMAEACENLI